MTGRLTLANECPARCLDETNKCDGTKNAILYASSFSLEGQEQLHISHDTKRLQRVVHYLESECDLYDAENGTQDLQEDAEKGWEMPCRDHDD